MTTRLNESEFLTQLNKLSYFHISNVFVFRKRVDLFKRLKSYNRIAGDRTAHNRWRHLLLCYLLSVCSVHYKFAFGVSACGREKCYLDKKVEEFSRHFLTTRMLFFWFFLHLWLFLHEINITKFEKITLNHLLSFAKQKQQ